MKKLLISGLIILAASCGVSRNNTDYQYTEKPKQLSTNSATGSYLAGLFAYEDGNKKQAEDFLEHSLESNPQNIIVLNQNLQITLENGDIENAVTLSNRAIKYDPSSFWGRLTLGIKHMKLGEHEKAYNHIKQIRNDPIKYGPIVSIAESWSLAGMGKKEEAFKTIGQLKHFVSYKVLHHIHKSLLHSYFKEEKKAQSEIKKALSLLKSKRLYVLIDQFFHIKENAENSNEPTDALAQKPDQFFANYHLTSKEIDIHDVMVEGFYDITLMLIDGLNLNTAIIFNNYGLYYKPNDEGLLLMAASLYSKANQYEKALESLENIPQDTAFYLRGQLIKADILKAQKDEKSLVRLVETLEEKHPQNLQVPLLLADYYRTEKSYEKALTIYKRILKDVDQINRQHVPILFGRGIVLERLGKWKEAEEDLIKSLELYPDQPDILNYLGYSWIDRNINLEEGEKLLKKAVKLAPNNGYILDSLGWSYYKTKKFDKAIKYLEKAVEYVPNDAVITDHLADAYLAGGRQKEAIFQWNRALSFDPDEDLRQEIQEKIKSTEK